MSAYLFAKTLHVSCVILSLTGFAARGVLMLSGSPLLNARVVRVAPHVVDTVLLASAGWLCWLLQQYPFVHGWLTAKVVGLLLYIGFGTFALRRGKTRGIRVAAFACALAAAGYIVSVALTRDPYGPLRLSSSFTSDCRTRLAGVATPSSAPLRTTKPFR